MYTFGYIDVDIMHNFDMHRPYYLCMIVLLLFVVQMSLIEDPSDLSAAAHKSITQALDWCHRTYSNITCLSFSKCLPAKAAATWTKHFPSTDAKWMDIITHTTTSE